MCWVQSKKTLLCFAGVTDLDGICSLQLRYDPAVMKSVVSSNEGSLLLCNSWDRSQIILFELLTTTAHYCFKDISALASSFFHPLSSASNRIYTTLNNKNISDFPYRHSIASVNFVRTLRLYFPRCMYFILLTYYFIYRCATKMITFQCNNSQYVYYSLPGTNKQKGGVCSLACLLHLYPTFLPWGNSRWSTWSPATPSNLSTDSILLILSKTVASIDPQF